MKEDERSKEIGALALIQILLFLRRERNKKNKAIVKQGDQGFFAA